MPRYPQSHKTSFVNLRGFTLIEILIVMVILSITFGFALLSFGDFGHSRKIRIAGEQFSAYLKLVQYQAILENNTFGIRMNNKQYTTYYFKHGLQWEPMSERGLFHTRYFSDSMKINLKVDYLSMKNPELIINPSGEVTPFSIDFGTDENPKIMTLIEGRDAKSLREQ